MFLLSGQRDKVKSNLGVLPASPKNPAGNNACYSTSRIPQTGTFCSLEEEEEETHECNVMDDRMYSCSRLSKTLKEVLADKGALGYFIQFMDRRGSLALIKFWMEVECTCGPSAINDDTSLCPDAEKCKLRSDSLLNQHLPQYDQNKLSLDVVNSNKSESNVNQVITSGRRESLRQPVSTIKQDAFRIYKKYIANDSLLANGITDQVKNDIEKSVQCDNIQPLISCLKTVQASVYKMLEDE